MNFLKKLLSEVKELLQLPAPAVVSNRGVAPLCNQPGEVKPASCNKVLYIDAFTAAGTVHPVPVSGPHSVEEAFAWFRPSISVSLLQKDETETTETFSFSRVGDFSAAGITEQSHTLQQLQERRMQLEEILGNLRHNTALRKALLRPETREALIGALRALRDELDSSL